MSFLKKIISGGQTGADLAALVCGRRLGLETGGWAPKGWKTEKGPQPVLASYGLVEHASSSYPPRTEQNAADADATLVLSTNAQSPGTIQTVAFAKKHNKGVSDPVIDPFSEDAVAQIVAFLLKERPETLNVGGNRESKSPGITKKAAEVLAEAIGIACGIKPQGDQGYKTKLEKPQEGEGSEGGDAPPQQATIKYRCNQETKKWEVVDTSKGDPRVLFTSEQGGYKGRLEAIEEIARLATEN